METPIIETIETIKVRKTDDPEYFKNYYHTSGLGTKMSCELCGRMVSRQKMKRHQTTNLCNKVLNTFKLA